MKKAITLLTILLNFGYTLAQAPAIQWQKSLGGSGADFAQSIQPTADGGCIVAGSSGSANGDIDVDGFHGNYDCWLVKFNATGIIQWKKSLGGFGNDNAYAIQTTSDGGYIVAGSSDSNNGDVTGNHGYIDYWVVKLDAAANIQWQKSLGGSFNDFAYAIQATSDGGYVVAGVTQSDDGDVNGNHGGQDYWVVKLNATGTLQWQKSLGGSNNDFVNSIQATLDGGYVVAGYSNSTNGDVTGNHGGYDYWIVKLNANGTIQWQKSLGGSNYDGAWAIQIASDGGYVVAGVTQSNDGDVSGNHGSSPDYWVVKLDATGSILWQKALGGSEADTAYCIQTTSDGGYVVGGVSQSNNGDVNGNHGFSDFWTVKLNATGTLQWQKSLGGSGSEYAYAIQTTLDGGYVVAGFTDSGDGDLTGNHGSYDYWVVKLGTELATSAFEKNTIVIYPNPVCDILQIQTPKNTTITKAKIIAINGQVILEQTQNCNTINVENLAQGVYILETYSGQDKYTCKFIKE